MTEKEKRFVKIMADVWKHDAMRHISASNFKVLCAIALFVNDKGDAYPSVQTLADTTGYSERQGPDRKYIFRYRIAPGLVKIIEAQTPQEGA